MPDDICPGCGARLPAEDGPTHAYMLSSPACWARFGRLLEREYSNPPLMPAHRLSVDAYAVQHPGDPHDRRAIQSVGMHLARLMFQLQGVPAPRETNDIMLGFGKMKATLPHLDPPARFALTVADVPLDGSLETHVDGVKAWASSAWEAWAAHHDFIRDWAERALAR